MHTSWRYSPEAAERRPRLGSREELQAVRAPICSIWDWLLPAALGAPKGCGPRARTPRGSALHAAPAQAVAAGQSTSPQHTGVRTPQRQLRDVGPTGAQLALAIFSSGSPSSEIRGVAVRKQDVVCGISSLQIRVEAPCASLVPLSSTRTPVSLA